MKILLSLLFLILTVPHLFAERYAYLLALRAGTPELTAENKALCREFYDLLKQKGFKQENITWFSSEPETGLSTSVALTEVRRHLSKAENELKPDDELYIFSIGYLSANPHRVSLATTGGRMLGREFAERLDRIKARQFIFLFNTQGSALFAKLAHGSRLVVAATDDAGQMNPPRYPQFFLQEWKKDGAVTNWFELLRRTGKATEDFYKQHKIARTENSQFFNNGMTANYPFSKADSKNLTAAFQSSADRRDSGRELSERLAELTRIRKRNKPDKETGAVYDAARKAARQFTGFGAVYTDRNFGLIVNADKSAKLTVGETIFLNTKTGAGNFVYFSPGKGKIRKALVIYPDGSWTDFNTPSLLPGQYIRFSGLMENCVLRRETEIAIPVPSHLPEFQQTLALQTYFPAVQTEVVLQSDPKDALRYKLYNSAVKPRIENGKTIFTFGSIPAYSPLPFDDAPEKYLTKLLLTTQKSWNDFNEWSKRMTDRSAVLDQDAEAVLAGLAKDAKTDTDKIRRIYDYLCSLRYLTEPVGAGAFRPRTPGDVVRNQSGDCKDKANALVTMAEKLGIKAYRVLLNRMGESDPAFPSWQFNHMLVYIPKLTGYPDGLWLDPTDGSTKFGHLPPGDAGRIGMVLKKDGGEFKKVFTQKNAKNTVTEKIRLTLDSRNKRIAGTVQLCFTGMADYRMRQAFKHRNPVQADYFARSLLDSVLNGFRVKTFRLIHFEADQAAPLELEAEVDADAGNVIPSDIAAPGGLNKYFIAEKRTLPVQLENGTPYEYTQELEIRNVKLPEFRWKQENACLSAEIISGGNGRTIRIVIKNPRIPPSAYEETKRLIMKFNIQLKQWRNL